MVKFEGHPRPNRSDFTDQGYIKALEAYINFLEDWADAKNCSSSWR